MSNKKVMVVVAHPDDELLGPGATIHRLVHEFDVTVHVVILGEGITSRSENRDKALWEKELEIHQDNISQARKELGYQSLGLHSLPDNRFDSVDLLDIVKIVEKEKKKQRPEIVLTHHGGDLNIDHQLTFQAVMTACRPLSEESVRAIWTFETPSGTEWIPSTDPRRFIPNTFVDIHPEDLDAKKRAMECYDFEKRSWPHPRSPKALTTRAEYWGSVSGTDLAEAFCLVRHRLS